MQEYVNIQKWDSYLLDQAQAALRQQTNIEPKGTQLWFRPLLCKGEKSSFKDMKIRDEAQLKQRIQNREEAHNDAGHQELALKKRWLKYADSIDIVALL